MANRYFENEEHTKLYQKYRVQPPQPLIDAVLAYLKERYTDELDIAIDVGCGSGQNTFYYADHFKKVIGIDVSPNQIAKAVKANTKDNVTFEVSQAEKLKVEDESVQLITAMAAAHWFDLPKFWIDGQRALVSGGVMAFYCYSDGHLKWEKNQAKNIDINEVLSEVKRGTHSPLWEFWPPQILYAFNKYRDFVIPYDDVIRDEETYFYEREMSLSDVCGEIKTWAAFEKFKESNGVEIADKLVQELQQRILDIIKDDLNNTETSPDDIKFVERTSFYLLMARKT